MLQLLSICVAASGILISAVVGFVIAIFGDDIRSICRRPKLVVSIPDPEGEWTVLKDKKTQAITDHAIYFHALIENKKPARIAKDVELFIVECIVSDQTRTNRKMPLPCPLPIQTRRKLGGNHHDGVDVGSAPYAYDLFRCLKSGKIELLLNCSRPNNFHGWIIGRGTMKVTVEARGTNVVSNKLFWDVEWDGIFPLESDGLGDHLRLAVKCC